MIKDLSSIVAEEFIGRKNRGRLGCVLDTGEPYIVPVNYIFQDDCIYIHTMPGKKLSAMEANPKVCLQMDEIGDDGFEWTSVIAFGEFEQVSDKKKKLEILQEFYNRFPRFTPVEAVSADENMSDKIVVFRVKIQRLTGVTETYWSEESKKFFSKSG